VLLERFDGGETIGRRSLTRCAHTRPHQRRCYLLLPVRGLGVAVLYHEHVFVYGSGWAFGTRLAGTQCLWFIRTRCTSPLANKHPVHNVVHTVGCNCRTSSLARARRACSSISQQVTRARSRWSTASRSGTNASDGFVYVCSCPGSTCPEGRPGKAVETFVPFGGEGGLKWVEQRLPIHQLRRRQLTAPARVRHACMCEEWRAPYHMVHVPWYHGIAIHVCVRTRACTGSSSRHRYTAGRPYSHCSTTMVCTRVPFSSSVCHTK
jgi:hypothetical protein